MDLLFNTIGITGVSLILIAYFLLQTEKIKSTAILYNAMNLIGASLIMVSLYRFWNLPSFVIELFWMAISAYGTAKAIKRVRNDKA